MNQKSMIVLSRWGRQELVALIDSGALHTTLHWTYENVVHAIDLDSLINHKDHCQMCDRIFVHNCGVYGTGIGMPGLFVKTIDINKMFMVVNN